MKCGSWQSAPCFSMRKQYALWTTLPLLFSNLTQTCTMLIVVKSDTTTHAAVCFLWWRWKESSHCSKRNPFYWRYVSSTTPTKLLLGHCLLILPAEFRWKWRQCSCIYFCAIRCFTGTCIWGWYLYIPRLHLWKPCRGFSIRCLSHFYQRMGNRGIGPWISTWYAVWLWLMI